MWLGGDSCRWRNLDVFIGMPLTAYVAVSPLELDSDPQNFLNTIGSHDNHPMQRKPTHRIVSWLKVRPFALELGVSVVVAVVITLGLVGYFLHENTAQRKAIREVVLAEQKGAKLAPMAAKFEAVFEDIYHNARTIALMPSVRKLTGPNRRKASEDVIASGRFTADADETVRQIYNSLSSSVQVSEVYAILDGFDAQRGDVPFFVYDSHINSINAATDNPDPSDIPIEDEAEEYAYYPKALKQFQSQYPRFDFETLESVPALWSGRMRTCDNSQYTSVRQGHSTDADGLSLAVPIYSSHTGLVSGLIAVVIRTNVLEAMLLGVPFLPTTQRDILRATQLKLSLPQQPAPFMLTNLQTGVRVWDRRLAGPDQVFATGLDNVLSQPLRVHGQGQWVLQYAVPPEAWLARYADVDELLEQKLWVTAILAALLLGLRVLSLKRHHEATERRQREVHELEVAHERESRANRAKDVFLANMSHEIRTPMSGVIGMLQLLTDSKLAPQQQQHAKTALASAESLLDILNDILDITKLESGATQLELLDSDFHQLLRDGMALHRAGADQKGLVLQLDIADEVPHRLRIDPTRVRQILANLLSNAVKFTRSGRVDVVVRAQMTEDAGRARVTIQVKDTGIGIPADAMPTLFQRFQQADTSTTRRFGGSGLGLEISMKLAKLMHGTVRVESVVDQGSTFEVSFLAELPTDTAAPPAVMPKVKSAPMPLRILIVDDNPLNLLMLGGLLRKLGHHVDQAEGGRAAVAMAAKSSYDLIFMDAMMPDVDGVAASRQIREQASGKPSPRIVVATADVMLGSREKYLSQGFDGYISKPFNKSALQALLDDTPSITQ